MIKDGSNYKQAYIAWFVATLFYFYQYILRVSVGVMIDPIRHDFFMTAEAFGFLGSIYLYTYSVSQVPIGIVLDRIGIRNMVVYSAALCTLGTAILAFSSSPTLAIISRGLTGIGSGAAFMCSLKLAADYLPAGRRGLLIGTLLASGAMGAIVAGKPLVYIMNLFGWRSTQTLLAAIGALIAIYAFYAIPCTKLKDKSSYNFSVIKKQLLAVLKNYNILLYAILAIGLYTPLAVLADLWGTAFFMQKYSLTNADAAESTMTLYIGMAIGSILIPWYCEKRGVIDNAIKLSLLTLSTLLAIVLYRDHLDFHYLIVIMVTIGVFCGSEMLCFTAITKYTNKSNSGITIGVVNTLNMLGGAILQQLVGYRLDQEWSGEIDNTGIRIYSTEQFTSAFTILEIVIVICFIISTIFLRKKVHL
jgi:MFS family permease